MKYLALAIVLLFSCDVTEKEAVFTLRLNQYATIGIQGFEHEINVRAYTFPRKLWRESFNKISIDSISYLNVPLSLPSNEISINWNEKQDYQVMLFPNDTLFANLVNGSVVFGGKYVEINNYYFKKSSTNPVMIRTAIDQNLKLYQMESITDSLDQIELEFLYENEKDLPDWFIKYEERCIKYDSYFFLGWMASLKLSKEECINYFETHFDLFNPEAQNINNYHFVIGMYLDKFISDSLQRNVAESKTWLIGIDERLEIAQEKLPKDLLDSYLTHLIVPRIRYNYINLSCIL